MDIKIEKLDVNSPSLSRVIELGDANSATLGFLPHAAFKQAARQGNILVPRSVNKSYILPSVKIEAKLRETKNERSIMRGPKPSPIELSEIVHQELNKLVNRHTVGQQIALRGRIILAANEGKNNTEIAEELDITVDTVRLWRNRWLLLAPIPLVDLTVAERLEDLPRPGAPARITADQRCRIEQLACEQPEKAGRPITHWTNREIADEIMKQEIVTQISPRHAGRLLKRR